MSVGQVGKIHEFDVKSGNWTLYEERLQMFFKKLQQIINVFCKYSTEMLYEIETPYKLHRLQTGPPSQAILTSSEALRIYKKMFTMRRLEAVSAELYKAKLIRGFCHLYSGQEAVATGMHEVMRKKDSLITSYRCHAFAQLMRNSIIDVLAELTGRKTGCSRGKGGSMHMYGPNFYGGNGIVGSQVPMGTGIALAHHYKRNGAVSFTLYGDGAANQGQVFEAMNIAVLKKLPCAYVCENNIYGMGTSAPRSSSNTDYYTRGDRIPGILTNGMDVIACREATRFAIEYVVSGKGPILLEMKTYRYYGHSMSDPGTSYRTKEEIKKVRESSDPIRTFLKTIINAKLVTEEQIEEITKSVRDEVSKAAQKASKDPVVDDEELMADVHKLCLCHNQVARGVHPLQKLKHFHVEHAL